jgi:hypothetical protein
MRVVLGFGHSDEQDIIDQLSRRDLMEEEDSKPAAPSVRPLTKHILARACCVHSVGRRSFPTTRSTTYLSLHSLEVEAARAPPRTAHPHQRGMHYTTARAFG